MSYRPAWCYRMVNCVRSGGDELGDFLGPQSGAGIIVGARLRTRRADTDTPFAVAFSDVESLLGAVEELAGSSAPFWHLAFLNRTMAAARKLGNDHLLFGAYPNGRAERAEASLEYAVGNRGGRFLGAAEAHRTWGERFYPVAPSPHRSRSRTPSLPP